MIKIGLTGGIGCGKTTVSEKFKQIGISVLNTDLLAREIIDTNDIIILNIKKEFGELSYIDNKLNRKYISNIVFNNSDKLTILNNITHPLIRKEILKWIDTQKNDFCVVESAIMLNSDLHKLFDYLVCVAVDEDTQIERIIKRDNCSKQEALLKINKQISQKEMMSKCKYVIYNDSSINLDKQINFILKSIKNDILSKYQ